MQETVISVRGEFSARYPAERATVQIEVSFDGPERGVVFESATRAAESVRGTVAAPGGREVSPLTWSSAGAVTVWSDQPLNPKGKPLATLFHSRLALSTTFSDLPSLSRWIEAVMAIDGVSVGSIVWSLTAARSTAAVAEVRSRAVKDAVSKATVYAQSIGLGSVRAVAIADPGMLDDLAAGAVIDPGSPAHSATVRTAGPAGMSLAPHDIEVIASVDARFVAS
jgi:hypothetical protein